MINLFIWFNLLYKIQYLIIIIISRSTITTWKKKIVPCSWVCKLLLLYSCQKILSSFITRSLWNFWINEFWNPIPYADGFWHLIFEIMERVVASNVYSGRICYGKVIFARINFLDNMGQTTILQVWGTCLLLIQ